MGMFDWLRRKPAEQKVSAAGYAISSIGPGRPVWSDRDYAAFSSEGYRRNAVVFRCVKMIASGASTVPWLLYSKDGAEIEEHALLQLLQRPNSTASGRAFFEAFYAYLLLAGNTYIEGVGPDGKPYTELWNQRPDRMRVIPGEFGLPAGYEMEANGILHRWQADQLTGEGPILHLKDFHPLDDWYGMSRMEAAAYGVDRHNESSVHNMSLLQNGGRPSGMLVFEPVRTGPESFAFAPESAIEAAEARFASNNVGALNAGRPLITGGAVKWQEMGITPKDMDYAISKDDSARDICAAFGVPHILVVPGSSTYNNVREAKLELWEDTILPVIDLAVDALNSWLVPSFGDGMRLGIDLDEISALEFRRETKRKGVIELLDKGVIDRTEAREALQYDPKPEMVSDPDASVITALVNAVEIAGLGPLAAYLRSVGLIDENATEEDLMGAATAFVEEMGPTQEEEVAAAVLSADGEASPEEGDA